MDVYMQVVTERMKDLSERLLSVSQEVEKNCGEALQSLEDLSHIFAAMSKWSIVSVQQRVQEHLKTGRNALEQSIQEYENANAEIVKSAEGIHTVTVNSSGTNVSYQVNQNDIWEYADYASKCDNFTRAEIYQNLAEIAIPKVPQIDSYYKNRKTKDTGICNISSVTNLLNRRYAMDGGQDNWFTYKDALEANGCKLNAEWINKDNRMCVNYDGGTGCWARDRKYTNGEVAYYTHTYSETKLKQSVSNDFSGSYEEYFAAQLEEHPEGVCIRLAEAGNDKVGHVITITDFSRDENGVHLYVDDPVNIEHGQEHVDIKNTAAWKKYQWNFSDNCALTYLDVK